MISRICFTLLVLCGLAHAEGGTIKTDLNEFKVSYHHRAGMRMLPHSAIDQVIDSVKLKYGVDSVISFERGFSIGANRYGYAAYDDNGETAIFLISSSKGNINSMTVTGICKKGDWRFELIKLLELTTLELDKLDRIDSRNE